MYKIGVLIPTTSSDRDWKSFHESTLFTILFNTFVNTYCNQYEYIFYLIVDDDDKIFGVKTVQQDIQNVMHRFKNIHIKFISSENIPKGWVTKMWNRAFQIAYNEKCDYFFQCGDDIYLKSKKWVSHSICALKENNNIGLTGPIDIRRIELGGESAAPGGYRFIQTQAFVSRKHMDLFGYFFPEEIKNWFCDNWITQLYYPKYFYQIEQTLANVGGEPRYEVEENPPWQELIERDKKKLP